MLKELNLAEGVGNHFQDSDLFSPEFQGTQKDMKKSQQTLDHFSPNSGVSKPDFVQEVGLQTGGHP